ncbi:MAG: Arc family DNA-binding protein [Chitinophagaceae bacterium]|nr:Arc family DNA-binding protein [Chitinophagaceae bacterium]
MGNKKSFVLRMDEDVYKAIEKWAADEFRSVNGQIEWILNQQLKTAGRAKAPRSNLKPKKD